MTPLPAHRAPPRPAPGLRHGPAGRIGIAAALLAVLATGPAVAAVLTVGAPGTGCNHTNIQAAIEVANDNPGADTIRIARNATWTAQQLVVDTHHEISLVGGYATCTSASPSGPATVLSGAGGDARPVITVRGNGFVFLRNLTIQDGDHVNGTSIGGQGGGINFLGGGILDIADTAIVQNQADHGGGIHATGTSITAEVVLGDNVTVGFNTARSNGGGLWVGGLEFSVRGANSSILFNEAAGDVGDSGYGGGALVTSTQDFPGYLYISAAGIGGLGAVYSNTARHGGGLAVVGGVNTGRTAQTRIFTGHPGSPVRISANTASGRGGGLYLATDVDASPGDANALAYLWYAHVDDNTAADGAAFYLNQDDAFASTSWSNVLFNALPDMSWLHLPPPSGALPCPAAAACGSISRNRATAPAGAVIKHQFSGGFAGRRLLIQDNQGARLVDVATIHDLFNVLVTGNVVTQELFRQPNEDGDFLTLQQATIADNSIGAPHVMAVNDNLRLVNSLVWQPGKLALAAGANDLVVDYVLTNDSSNMPTGPAAIAAPRFIDPANGDYRLRAGSRGVDYAMAAAVYAASSRETLDGRAHDIDVPNAGINAPNRLADVGAYERPALLPLVLNADFDASLNLWDGSGLADSFWDGTQNAAGPSGSGSARVVFNTDPKGNPEAPRLAGVSQCVHLPGPGLYQLNGWGRVVPGSNPPLTSNRVRLVWELRYDGGRFGCTDGAPNLGGSHQLATGTAWTRPGSPAVIEVPAAVWTQDTSLTIKLDVLGGPINPPTAWFDGITLDLLGDDTIFANGFQ